MKHLTLAPFSDGLIRKLIYDGLCFGSCMMYFGVRCIISTPHIAKLTPLVTAFLYNYRLKLFTPVEVDTLANAGNALDLFWMSLFNTECYPNNIQNTTHH